MIMNVLSSQSMLGIAKNGARRKRSQAITKELTCASRRRRRYRGASGGIDLPQVPFRLGTVQSDWACGVLDTRSTGYDTSRRECPESFAFWAAIVAEVLQH